MNRLARWASLRLEALARRPSTRRLAGLLATALKTTLTRRWHWISYDARGWWTNRQRGATFFAPTLHTGTLDGLTRQVKDFWCPTTALQAGDVVIDVGAGTGDHVLVFSRQVGSTGRVIAVEAHPQTAHCLQLTVNANVLTNTSVFGEAAWNEESTLQMSDEDAHEGNAIGGSAAISVRARPVDAMLAPMRLEKVDLIKVNVEGAELEALAGMRDTLAKAAAIVVSCHDFLATRPDDPRRTKARVIPFLEAAGFTVTLRPDAPFSFAKDYVYGRRQAQAGGSSREA